MDLWLYVPMAAALGLLVVVPAMLAHALRQCQDGAAGVGLVVVLAVAAAAIATSVLVVDAGDIEATPVRTISVATSALVTTTTAAPTTTTTTTTTAPPPARRSISSTMYCERGHMANGELVHNGAVSSKVLRRGTRWRVVTGPHAGRLFVVKDTGSRAYFDMWTASCPAAVQYGRRPIVIEAA